MYYKIKKMPTDPYYNYETGTTHVFLALPIMLDLLNIVVHITWKILLELVRRTLAIHRRVYLIKLQLLSIAMRKEIKTKFSKMCRLVRSRVTIKCLIPVQQRSQQFYLSPCIYEEYHPPGYRRLHIQQGSFSLSFYCPCMGLLWNLVELQRSNDLHLSFFLEIEWFFFGFHGRTWQNMYWDWTLDVPDWSRMIEVFLLDNTVCIE